MSFDVSRRRFFGGKTLVAPHVLRPPGAVEEASFLTACTRCNACIQQCPEGIVVRGDGGYPVLDFMRGECSFCLGCVNACAPRALRDQKKNRMKAALGEACLAAQGVICQVCSEQCDRGAIQFQRLPGSIPRPSVRSAACNGCGACVAPCPVSAIHIEAVPRPFDPQESSSCTSQV